MQSWNRCTVSSQRAAALGSYHDHGGHILGICGGYQMLGRRIVDPSGVEGPPGETPGLDLLPVETEMRAPKTTTRTCVNWEGVTGEGYEIHMGVTTTDEQGQVLQDDANAEGEQHLV